MQDTQFRKATPSRIRLLVFLYHVMQGNNYQTTSNQFAIRVSNVSKCVHDVSHQILIHMYDTYVYLPTNLEVIQNMHAWQLQSGIPGIVGAIDGTHIAIKKPKTSGETYYNHKCYYSLNVQGTSLIFFSIN